LLISRESPEPKKGDQNVFNETEKNYESSCQLTTQLSAIKEKNAESKKRSGRMFFLNKKNMEAILSM
jgi:hypothetical protein